MRKDRLQTLIWGVALGLVGCRSQREFAPTDSDSGAAGVAAAGRNAAGGAGSAGAPGNAGVGGTSALAGSGGSLGGASAGSDATAGSGGNPSPPSGGSAPSGGTGAIAGSSSGSGGNGALGGAAGGGAAGSAGAAPVDPPCPPSTPRSGGKQYCSPPAKGTAVGNYSYDLWSDAKGTGCMTVYGVDAAFKANWMNVGDWIARVGLSFDQTKTYDQIGTFSSDFAYTISGVTPGGFGNLGIYGWTVNPLHEFYIEENWLGKAPNFTKVASFTIEGEGTYEVMTNTQTNQPNITGTNATFVQYWSVRTTPRLCGHISISKHFDEWKSLGLSLGKLEEARISIEGQNNSGTVDFTTATLVVTH